MEFYAPQFQPTADILGSYLRGRQTAIQNSQQNQLGAQQLEQGQLSLDQSRIALQLLQQRMSDADNIFGGQQPPAAGTAPAGAQYGGGATGGIQNGPQASVAPTQQSGDPLSSLIGRLSMYNAKQEFLRGGNAVQPLEEGIRAQSEALHDAIERRKLQLEPVAIQIKNVITSGNPERLLMANPQTYGPYWQKYAPALQIDPFDPKSMTPDNVRAVATLAYNNEVAANSAGSIAPLDMPAPLVSARGSQGQPLQVNPITHAATLEPGAQAPTYDLKETVDPITGKKTGKYVQTGGFGWNKGPASGSGGVDLGSTAPTPDQAKAATFADAMRSSLATMRKMENSGFILTPSQRSLIMDAATNENPGVIHSLLSQEGLSKLGKQGQTYLAAMMPLIQAVSHDQAGARVTTSQLRMNLESMIPPASNNPDALKVINENRDTFYRGLLVGSGPASQAPEFQNTIGADRQNNKSAANSRPAMPNVGDVIKGHRFKGGDPSLQSSWEKVGG